MTSNAIMTREQMAIEDVKRLANIVLTEPDIKRFWSKVKTAEGDACWIWSGGVDKNGYGRIGFGGRKGREFFAHRVSYFLHYAELPDNLGVCHSCDTPACVNPAHLWLGTQKDNLQDMAAKDRRKGKASVKGEQVGTSKLKAEQIPEIRRAFASGMKQRDIAKLHGVSQATVWQITSGRYWKHVQEGQ